MALALNQTAHVDLGALGVTGYPFTLAGWFRVPSVAVSLTLLRIDNTPTAAFHALVYEANASGQAAAVSRVGGVTGAARSTVAMTPGQWQHVVGVFEAHDLRRVYLDGGNMGSNAHLRVFDGANLFRAGNFGSSHGVDTAEVAVFAAALSADEIAMLGEGFPVLALPQAHALLAYHDLVRGINRPGIGAVAAFVGTPAVVDHARVMPAVGGRALAQPCRCGGPFRVAEEAVRTAFAARAQPAVAGVVEGELGGAGAATVGTILCGEAS